MFLLRKERLENGVGSERIRAGFDLKSAWIAIFFVFLKLFPRYSQRKLIWHVLKHVPISSVAHGLQDDIPLLGLAVDIVCTGHCSKGIGQKRGARGPCKAILIPYGLKHFHHQARTRSVLAMRWLQVLMHHLIDSHNHVQVNAVDRCISF